MNGAPSTEPETLPRRHGVFADVTYKVIDGRKRAVAWTHQRGDQYVVTGVDVRGRRFKQTYGNWWQAEAINIWRGTRWLVRQGRRLRLQTVRN